MESRYVCAILHPFMAYLGQFSIFGEQYLFRDDSGNNQVILFASDAAAVDFRDAMEHRLNITIPFIALGPVDNTKNEVKPV